MALSFGDEAPAEADYQILVSGRPSAELLDASQRLTTVLIPWAGVPPQTRERALERPHLAVHNLHHNAAATAEMGLALLLAAAKRLVPADQALRAHDWRPRYDRDLQPALQLEGKTALVVGLGAIGRRLARSCRALGMRVLGIRRRANGEPDPDVDELHGLEALPELLPRSQALLLALPHTPATEALIGPEQLALLPRGALLVNVGRGKLIDEEALYQALVSGHLHGAGLDVWWRYPKEEAQYQGTPPGEHPLWELDQVALSPHRAGHVQETEAERMDHLARALLAAARGEEIPHRVDLEAGY